MERNRPLRVLHLNAGNLYGGIETYLHTLARLRHLGPEMEPHFGLCFAGRLRDELQATGVPVYDLGPVRLSRPWTVLRARRRLKRLLQQTTFDGVVTHGCWPHVVFAPVVKRAGVRLACAVHGGVSRDHWLDRWAARTPPDIVVANSRFTATSAQSVFLHVPTTVVYPPLLEPEAIHRDEVRTRVRMELNTGPDTVVVLIVSRIEPLKGHAVLFEALGRLRDGLEWGVWIAGGANGLTKGSYCRICM